MDDSLYNQIVTFYNDTDRKYPQSIYDIKDPTKRLDAKSLFRKKAKPFHADSGTLFHGEKEVLPKTRIPSILKAFHDNPTTGGHFGRDKTFHKISARYYWKGMKNDIQEYVKACTKCFVRKPKIVKEAPPLNPIPVPAKIWSLVGIDIIGPLQETTSGNKYIVAMTDHFSKWCEASTIANKNSREVAQFLYTVVCRLGCMDILISNGNLSMI